MRLRPLFVRCKFTPRADTRAASSIIQEKASTLPARLRRGGGCKISTVWHGSNVSSTASTWNCPPVHHSATPPLRHSAFCIDGCDLSMLYQQGADDLDLHRASSSGSATMLSLRRAWLVKDADDPSIFSAFGKKQAAQTFAPAAGCRLAVINPHPQKQNVPVRQVVSRAGSRNKGWANRRLRVCDGVFSLGNDGEGKFLDRTTLEMKASFLDVGGRVSMPIGLILCYSTKAPQSNLVIKSPKATRAGSSESSRTDLPNLQIPCSATVKGFARNTSPLGASCFNTWSKSFNWAIGMFREKEYRKSYQASIFNIRSFFPSTISYSVKSPLG